MRRYLVAVLAILPCSLLLGCESEAGGGAACELMSGATWSWGNPEYGVYYSRERNPPYAFYEVELATCTTHAWGTYACDGDTLLKRKSSGKPVSWSLTVANENTVRGGGGENDAAGTFTRLPTTCTEATIKKAPGAS